MKDTQYLDGFIRELLHINEVSDNKLIDLGASGGAGTYLLEHTCIDLSAYALTTIAERIGKTGNTVLLNSAKAGGEQRVNRRLNTFGWKAYNGGADVAALHAFIENARRELVLRGNNPLFFGVGALKWRVAVKERGKDVLKDVTSPLLVFPVKLVVSGNASPVAIEFIDDEIYVNPCLIAKLEQLFGEELVAGLPKIGGRDNNLPVDLQLLGDGAEYFRQMAAYIDGCNHTDGSDDTRFEFNKDIIAIAQYKHDELCTYYDIRRNRDKIYSHPLVEKLFEKSSPSAPFTGEPKLPAYVLQRDSVQEKIITSVLNGESLIIKGPPGTGKTVTIANMLAALLSENKKVLFASKKISALTEVYAKLPENLRKFTMLLDCETESNAAKLRPEELKTDFKKLLAEAKEYREPAQLSSDVNQTLSEKAKAMRSLSAYIDLAFNDKSIAGDSFYAALDATCKHSLPVVEFADGEQIKNVTRAQYNEMLAGVTEAQRCFEILGENGAHPVYKCPYFGIDLNCDTEGALKSSVKIGEDSAAVYYKVNELLSEYSLDAKAFSLAHIAGVTACKLDEKQLTAIVNDPRNEALLKEIEKRLNELVALPEPAVKAEIAADGETVIKLKALSADKTLTLNEVKLICANADAFIFADGAFIGDEMLAALKKLVDDAEVLETKCSEHVRLSHEVFKEDLDDESKAYILSAAECLASYFENCPSKPKGLDFKAKKAYAKLRAMSYLSAPSFGEVVKAVGEYRKASDFKREADATLESAYKIFHRRLTDEQLACVRLVVKKCASERMTARAYITAVTDNKDFITDCFFRVKAENAALTLGELTACFERAHALKRLTEKLTEFNEIAPVYGESDFGKEVAAAKSLIGAGAFLRACLAQNADCETSVNAVLAISSQGVDTAKITAELEKFGKSYFRNYYVINGDDNTLGDLLILGAQADDRNAIAAAAKYTAIKNAPTNALDLGEFLYYFEKGGKLPDGVTFADFFEHSFFSLAVRARNAELGIMRNGLGAFAEDALKKLKAADEKLCELNAAVTEGKCLARIKPNDDDFIFVQDRNPNENMRLMFKRHARAILKLKKCLILSPYTASLLFRDDDFEDFDVLIIDEASQLEPALALPVLFRSKQCVIVGDEWQMPPIKHFTALSPVNETDGEEGYGSLEPEISVLGLALRNEGFAVEELVCHYRSKTETLIKFSQEKFYPNMRTFPAPVPAMLPAKGVPPLGLRDVYVPDGVVSLGRNVKEAEKVVEELNAHFDNYFDDESGKLSLSVGVVAFGEAQCSLIESKVRADGKLSEKIHRALDNFDDLPEKLIFFKTIETVQGQETGHLILSLTHGRRESGLYMHFGQLNQGKLGRCIFNVAVTRAQYAVTVVHSVKASEVSGSVDYIGEYLQTVERFAGAGREQFVSEKPQKGFVNEVAEFIRAQGVEPERVVVNYGVTDGSVRMPIAVLSKDLKKAILGVWCETPTGGRYDYLDYNLRYKNTLINCGWKIHSIKIHDWVDNAKTEREALEKVLSSILKEEEKENGKN